MLLHFSHMSGGKYLLGDYDEERDKFAVTSGGDLNFGPMAPPKRRTVGTKSCLCRGVG